MLVIARELLDAVVAHARRDHPQEACGVIAGPAGSEQPSRVVPLVNAACSTTRYEVAPAALLSLYRELAARGEEAVVVYHSHTATPAYPSTTDVALATDPRVHHLLVSTRHVDAEEVRSYRIVDGRITEEPVHVVGDPAAPAPHPRAARAD